MPDPLASLTAENQRRYRRWSDFEGRLPTGLICPKPECVGELHDTGRLIDLGKALAGPHKYGVECPICGYGGWRY